MMNRQESTYDEVDLEDKMQAIKDILSKLGMAKFKDIPSMSIEDCMNHPVVLVDVRSAEEREVSTIPNSISFVDYEENAEKYADSDVVVFDTVGYVSAAYACNRRRMGYENVKYMGDGGIIGWSLISHESLVKPDGSPATSLHTFMLGLGGLIHDNLKAEYFPDAQTRLVQLTTHWNTLLSSD